MGIEPATCRFVAYCLNHYVTAYPETEPIHQIKCWILILRMPPAAAGMSVGHCVAGRSDYCPSVLQTRSGVDLEIFSKKDTLLFEME